VLPNIIMTGEHSDDCRPEILWIHGVTHFTSYSVYVFLCRDLLIRERWLKEWWRETNFTTPTDITQSGYLPTNPEEDSSGDSDLPQGQDFDVILSDVEDSPPRQLVRTQARSRPPSQAHAHRGGKRPRTDMFAWNDHHAVSIESDEEGDEVDLKTFFKRHRVEPRRQVPIFPCLICGGLFH